MKMVCGGVYAGGIYKWCIKSNALEIYQMVQRKELSKAAVPRRLMHLSLLVVETPVRRFRYGGAVLASSLRVGTLESVGHHNL